MAKQLTGTLKGPYGDGLPRAELLFEAKRHTEDMPQGASASTRTDAEGAYTVQLLPGLYDVRVRLAGASRPTVLARDVYLDDETLETSVNQIAVQNQGEMAATPQLLLDMRAVKDETWAARDETLSLFGSAQEVDDAVQVSLATSATNTATEQSFRLVAANHLQMAAAHELSTAAMEQRVRLMIEDLA